MTLTFLDFTLLGFKKISNNLNLFSYFFQKTNVREFQPNGIGIYLGMESEEEGVESSLLPTNNDTYKSQVVD